MNDQCDVLIVGGGPAGAICAERLRAAGVDVLVVEQKQFPRVKPCAGWITPPVVELVKLDVDEYRQGRVFQPLTAFCTGIIGGRQVETRYEQPVSFGILRREFDSYLLDRSGARREHGVAVRSIERDGGGWLVNGSIRARFLIGAGGHFCPVAKMLGARSGEKSVVAAQEAEFEASPNELARGTVRAEAPELFFCEDLKGYGWCFRKGNYLNIGLGRIDSAREVSTHVKAFCDFLRSSGKVAGDLSERFHGHAYQVYERSAPKLVGDGVLLIGDAAGLAYPQSGEGIRPAIESSLIAADALVASGLSSAGLDRYSQRVTERFGVPRSRSASDWLPESFLRFLAQRLLCNQFFSRHIVLDRWFFHANEPALALSD